MGESTLKELECRLSEIRKQMRKNSLKQNKLHVAGKPFNEEIYQENLGLTKELEEVHRAIYKIKPERVRIFG
jgi:hypothetical protein